jgi:ATP-binding cassette subfamily B protein
VTFAYAPADPSLTLGMSFRHVRTAMGLALRAAPGHVAAALVLALAAGSAPVSTVWLTGRLLDGLVSNSTVQTLVALAAALAVCGIAALIMPRLAHYNASELGRRVRFRSVDQLFTALHDRLRGLSTLENPQFHTRIQLAQQAGSSSPGDLVNSVTRIGTSVVSLFGFAATLVAINPWLLLAVTLAAIPTLRAEMLLSRLRVGTMWGIGYTLRRQFFYANLLSAPAEAKEIRLFGLGAFFRERMLAELRSANVAERTLDRKDLRVQAVLGVLGAAVAGGGTVWAVIAARSGDLSVGEVTVFVGAIAAVQGALSAVVDQLSTAYRALLTLDHFVAATTVEPDLPGPATVTPVPALTDRIEINDVWFRYGPDLPWILRGVSLTIGAGTTTALVGLNGAGKSTLVKLLCRLYDPTKGSISWNGIDLRDMDPAQLRCRIGTVFQDYVQYELSAAENIGLGDVAHLEDRYRIEAAGKRAGIHTALTNLPRGYDTMLTRMFIEGLDTEGPDTGVLLSGGQGQRLALARALRRENSDLLILDEPSSGLDAEAEAEIHAELRDHRIGRTSLLISHRLNTVRDADQIAVLDGGRITERGHHDTLIARGGRYAHLFTLQATGFTATQS